MTAITATIVTASGFVHSGGMVQNLFTASTGGSGDTVDLSTWYENIYYVRAFTVADGTDAEAFITDTTGYGNDITITQNKGSIQIEVVGTPIKSTGGST